MRSAAERALPYISAAELERARWMTLAEALAHVAEHDRCDRRSALKQLRDALGDGKLHYEWAKERLRLSTYYLLYAHRPPKSANFWQRARIRGAKVFDPETNIFRTLLILKDDIFQLWPKRPEVASVASAGSESGQAGEATKAKGRGRPKVEKELHHAFDRLSQQGYSVKNTPWKQLEALIDAECSQKWSLRTKQKYKQSWLQKRANT
jgi:hypothetical protein